MKITRFEDIDAWNAARELNKQLFQATHIKLFTSDFHLQDQIRLAGTSAMANIAEGFDSGTDPEFVRFLRMARRSASEIQSHLYVALDREYLDKTSLNSLYAKAMDVKRLIGGFIKYLKSGS